jgi:CRISPR-associated protein Cmr5
MQTNSQKMALSAYQGVAGAELTGEFKSFARGFPTMAHTSGLAQAIAFAQGKGEEHHKCYLRILAKVLTDGGFGAFDCPNTLREFVGQADASEYMRISRGAFIAADWIKRYAEALAPEKPGTPEADS